MAYPKGMPRYRTESGFTIIEILITMSIAGLIMVVVFIAIPQLQRNARNEARKRDTARLIAAVHECIANNRGKFRNCHDAKSIHFDIKEFAQYTEFGVLKQTALSPSPAYQLSAQTPSGYNPSVDHVNPTVNPDGTISNIDKAPVKVVDGPVILFTTKCINGIAFNDGKVDPISFTSSSILEGGSDGVGYCVSSDY